MDQVLSFPDKLSRSLATQQSKLAGKLDRQTEKYLQRLLRQEKKLRRKLDSKDSLMANQLGLGSDSLVNSWKNVLSADSINISSLPAQYSGKLDSMNTALKFLKEQPGLNGISTAQYDKLMQQYGGLQGQLNQTEQLKKLVQERKQLLMDKLANSGVSKQLKQYQKQVFYYQQQLQEYRAALENPQMLEKKALEVLSKVPAFRKYFDKFSQLGSMFRLPGQTEDMDPSAMLAGLQTRQNVLAELNNRLGGSANTQQAMANGFKEGQSELSSLKSKLTSSLNRGEPVDMPGFKPNTEKSKSFLKRLELGTNMQSTRANNYFPTTSDLGLSVGYKLNPKSIIGIGASYKVGWGESIRKIRVTHEGMGLRTFFDWKIKGKIWATGGGEWNYRSRFDNLSVVKSISQWQQSALLGMQMKQSVGKYKATASLLYDALWQNQVPKAQPVLFRVGYNF
ncbi:hypothetical protein [Flavihumibacter solisilvae]|nr:hypothetical protein [Flavihumibacter solisilvae]